MSACVPRVIPALCSPSTGQSPDQFTVAQVHAALAARGKISRAKFPSQVIVCHHLPKNDSGKVVKPALVAAVLSGTESAPVSKL